MEFRLEVYDEVGSTNEVVKRALEAGEPEGLAVGARVQTAGYGRQGRSWASPAGGMYVSLLLRPDVPLSQLPTLSLVAACAVRRALTTLADEAQAKRVRIKWPNDVVLSDFDSGSGSGFDSGSGSELGSAFESSGSDASFRKLCGISLERHAGGVCVGVGVNVASPQEEVPLSGKNAPAYVSELRAHSCELASGDELVAQVRAAVLEAFSALYATWCGQGFAPLASEYEQHAELTGRFVAVENLDGSLLAEGVVRGVDEWGRLLVLPDDAPEPMALSSGEVHIRSLR